MADDLQALYDGCYGARSGRCTRSGDLAEAQDAVQEALVRALAGRRRFGRVDNPRRGSPRLGRPGGWPVKAGGVPMRPVAVFRGAGSVLYALNRNADPGSAVIVSDDDGRTWRRSPLPPL